jgi:hypothetical protein
MKKKYSKITLLAHFDGELTETQSTLINDYLMDDKDSSQYLEEIIQAENSIINDPSVEVRDITKDKIFSEAFSLMEKRKTPSKVKSEKTALCLPRLSEIFKNLSFEFQYGFAALTFLIVTTFYVGRGSVIPGKLEAFSLDTVVYSQEETGNNLESMNFESDNTSEEI